MQSANLVGCFYDFGFKYYSERDFRSNFLCIRHFVRHFRQYACITHTVVSCKHMQTCLRCLTKCHIRVGIKCTSTHIHWNIAKNDKIDDEKWMSLSSFLIFYVQLERFPTKYNVGSVKCVAIINNESQA